MRGNVWLNRLVMAFECITFCLFMFVLIGGMYILLQPIQID